MSRLKETSFAKRTEEKIPKKKILYVDMDGVLVNFQSGIDKLDNVKKSKYHGRYDEVPNIFSIIRYWFSTNPVTSFSMINE